MTRIARSLDKLRSQINAASPYRSKKSDGWIGDTAHAARKSDHNPDKSGVVRALDITHDPAHGIDGGKLAQSLIDSRDDRISYIISNGQIASGAKGPSPWKWRKYNGSNPHNHHMHISVLSDGDDRAWNISIAGSDAPAIEDDEPLLVFGDKGDAVERMQERLRAHGYALKADGDFGKLTRAAVRDFQHENKLVEDGKVGAHTWENLQKTP